MRVFLSASKNFLFLSAPPEPGGVVEGRTIVVQP
jgi:hypothetical protein